MLSMRLQLRRFPNININNLKWFQQQPQQDLHIPNSTSQDIITKILSKITDLNRMKLTYWMVNIYKIWLNYP